MRAFTFRQIGFLLDGIPLGRSDQFGGSPIYRYVDNENLLRVTASAGSGDVTLPSYASLGPLVNYLTVAPAHALGFGASQTFGSDKLRRTALRVDTGNFGPLSAYVSGSKVKGDLWRGPGTIDREHYEGKVRYDVADTTNVTLQAAHNEYFDFDSPAISLAQYAGTTPAPDPFGRSGRDFSYIGFVPTLAQTTPGVAVLQHGLQPVLQAGHQQPQRFAVRAHAGIRACRRLAPRCQCLLRGQGGLRRVAGGLCHITVQLQRRAPDRARSHRAARPAVRIVDDRR